MTLDQYFDGLCFLIPEKGFETITKGVAWDFRHHAILFLLEHTDGNVAEAARIAKIDRPNFQRLIAEYDIDADTFRPEDKKYGKSKNRK